MSSEDTSHNNLQLEKRLWYRFVKVVYILVYLLFLLLVVFLGYSDKPYTYIDSDKSLIVCSNTKAYPAGKNSIYIDSDGSLSDYNDEDARKLCEYDIIKDYSDKYETPSYKNYEVKVVHSTRGSWESVLTTFLIGIAIVYTIFEIIKRVFLYIVVGKSMMPKILSDD